MPDGSNKSGRPPVAPSRARIEPRGREYEVAYYTKELGRPLQRRMLKEQLDQLHESAVAARHGEDAGPQAEGAPPREDRAG